MFSNKRQFRIALAAITALSFGVAGLTSAHATSMHALSSALPATVPMLKSGERAFVNEMRVIVPKLKRQKPGPILSIGRKVCELYADNGRKPWVTSAIKAGMKGLISPAAANLVISSATRNLCPRFAFPSPAGESPSLSAPEPGTPKPSPTPAPTPTPTPTPTKLVLPENSGWAVDEGITGIRSLKAPATIGAILPLGNAASLGISFYGITCSGEWFESGFVGVEFLDQNGAVIPTIIGTPTHLFGYSAGRSRINSSGCGGETLNLKEVPTATSVRIVSDSGRNGSISLFANQFL